MGLSFVTIPAAFAEPVEITKTTTTTTTSGTVSEFGPDRILIRTQTAQTPVGYTFTKTTTYVDEAGVPVSVETVKSGLPVTVYYSKDGDRMVATKVVVRRMAPPEGGPVVEKRTTTQTNTLGTISEFGPDRLVIREEKAFEPTTYGYTKRTTYVDETGAPVAVETIRSGVPVTVYYTREGDRLIADRVVVRRATTRGGVPLETRTTRTTTEEIEPVKKPGLFDRLKQKRNEERVREDAERLQKSEEKLRREKKD